MKKTLALLLIPVFLFCLVSCGGKEEQESVPETTGETASAVPEETAAEQTETETAELVTVASLGEDEKDGIHVLTAYFSEGDDVEDAAMTAVQALDCELFRIETEQPYPEDEKQRSQQIAEELERDVRPMLRDQPADISEYDVVIIGFPVWNGALPRAVCTFIEDHDMYGKAIIPFCAGGDEAERANCLNELARLCRLDRMTLCYSLEDGGTDGFADWLEDVLYGETEEES